MNCLIFDRSKKKERGMKRIIYALLIALSSSVLLQSFDTEKTAQREGTEPGHTGSPGDSLKTCTVCHGGTNTFEAGWITSNIPASGYIPGQVYSIRAVNRSFGFDRFGFQISPQDPFGNLLGTLVVTDSIKTKLVGENKYMTYRSGGVLSQDSMVWTFNWVAPADSVNVVVFYGAFNSNHGGHKFSDNTTLSTLRVYKTGVTGLSSAFRNNVQKVFPNPAHDHVSLQFAIPLSNAATMHIRSMDGKLNKATEFICSDSNSHMYEIRTASLSPGIYFIHVQDGKMSIVTKFIKQ